MLWRRGLAGHPGRIASVVGVWLLALWLFVTVAVALLGLSAQPADLRGRVTTILLAVATLAWPLATLLVVGSDETLDPGRFALFPVRARRLMPGLLACSLCGTGGALTVGLAALACWLLHDDLPALVAGLASLVVGTLTAVLLVRTGVTAFSAGLARRRSRDVTMVLVALFGVLGNLGFQVLVRFTGRGIGTDLVERLGTAATLVGWTPLGWAWALPWDAARRDWAALGGHLVLAVLLLAGLLVVWERSLDRALCSPLESGGQGGHVSAHGLADRMVPAGPAGAVAARCLRYWRRDPRHLVQLATMMMVPVLVVLPTVLDGASPDSEGLGLFSPAFLPMVFGGMTVAQEISTDGSALWMHVSAGIDGRDDRWGRLLAAGWVLVPVMVVVDLVLMALAHDWSRVPGVLGTSLGVLLVGAGVGSVTGAHWQVPSPPPGGNPFGRSSGGGAAGLALSLTTMLGTLCLSVPVLLLAGMTGARGGWGWLVLVAAPLYGLGLCWAGVRLGGRQLERTWPEVLAAVTWEGH